MMETEVYTKLIEHGVRPSLQRIAILQYLLTHFNHPTVDDVYRALCTKIPTLSRTTVYNTLRLLADHHVAQMLTIDDHHLCYDGNVEPHVHFICKECGKVVDLFSEKAPSLRKPVVVDGNIIEEKQLFYRGICKECASKAKVNDNVQ
ncbi:MAG: Fur family transcriptional regulator [Prevotella sp.]|nr:Fur family transcriptional regulator [Prevotella sp.]